MCILRQAAAADRRPAAAPAPLLHSPPVVRAAAATAHPPAARPPRPSRPGGRRGWNWKDETRDSCQARRAAAGRPAQRRLADRTGAQRPRTRMQRQPTSWHGACGEISFEWAWCLSPIETADKPKARVPGGRSVLGARCVLPAQGTAGGRDDRQIGSREQEMTPGTAFRGLWVVRFGARRR